MNDFRWFADVNLGEMSKKYKISYNTLNDWRKKQNDLKSDRGFLFDRLSMYYLLEENALNKIKTIFRPSELMALWGSLKATLISKDLVFNSNYLIYQFEDYCEYESMEAAQFGNLEDLKVSVKHKLSKLCEFEVYIFLDWIHTKDAQEFIFKKQ